MRWVLRLSLVVFVALGCSVAGGEVPEVLHHDLNVRIDPVQHRIEVVDRIDRLGSVVRDAEGGYRFVLHAGMAPEVTTPGWRLGAVEDAVEAGFLGINATTETLEDTVPLEGWCLVPEDGAEFPVQLRYAGVIDHELARQGEEYQRSFSETPGIISPEGVFLGGTSFWIPTFGDGLMTFDLEVQSLPDGWQVVSQGRRTVLEDGIRWTFEHPTEEVYLVGGPLELFEDRQGEVEVFAYLRSRDEALARRYLDATKRYLRLYDSMLPAYPFASFALVENFWETGYGMPGFTLLGPQVIRFPWILTSSYPHELLHNWWGNSVYVDFETGNWCEGLTAYMADHLLAENRGEGAIYRRSTLKKFTDLVSPENDFPLTEFHSRHSAASEAVGYGKSLMLFHMMRRSAGDQTFLEGVSEFYRRKQFQRASFADIADAFEAVGAGDLHPFVEAWTTRTGAPKLVIEGVRVIEIDDETHPWRLEMDVRQEMPGGGDPFPLALPIAVTLEGRDEALWVETGTCGGDCHVEIPCDARPLRIDVDPAFDVMRRLDPLEVPPAISTLMGADDPLFVLPSEASEDQLAAWKELAARWTAPDTPRTILDRDLEALPESPTWVLGWSNAFAGEIAHRLAPQGVVLDGEGLTLPEERVPRSDRSVVLVSRGATDPTTAVGFIGADPVAAIAGLARKLPHYQKYSYLAFKGDEPSNTTKGMWTPVSSPMVRNLSDGPLPDLVLPHRSPLAELPPVFDSESLAATVRFLADPSLEGRGLGSEGLERATAWVEERLAEIGLEPDVEGDFRQVWTWRGGEPEREFELTNLAARLPGSDPDLADHPVVVVAHLDHLGRGWPDVREGNEGRVHPGADDNASGVAVLLELARSLAADGPRPRPVVFLVTTGEEAGLVGARHWVETAESSGIEPFAAVNIDTVGRLKDGALYVLNTDTAREWRFIFMGVGYTTGAPVKIVTEPLDASDQGAFIDAGIPAVQLFTGPTADYHRPSDTVEKIDPAGMATVTEAAKEAVAYLAERKEPLTVTIAAESDREPRNAGHPGGGGDEGGRRASLGTIPDFGHQGPGVRVQGVVPNSAAEAAGIESGDIVIELAGRPVEGLRALSQILKSRSPGDEVELKILRDGEEMSKTVVLTSR